MYQFPLKQMTTKSCPKKQNKALHILILASCYTIARSFQLRHFINKWNPNAFFDFSNFGFNPRFRWVHLLFPPAIWMNSSSMWLNLLGTYNAFCWENDDSSSAYVCHNKTKESISKQNSYTWNSSPLALTWSPFPVWLVCVALAGLFTAP